MSELSEEISMVRAFMVWDVLRALRPPTEDSVCTEKPAEARFCATARAEATYMKLISDKSCPVKL